jgi:hypothetical protein
MRSPTGGRGKTRAHFFEEWGIDAELGETAVQLEGDVGLVPLGGEAPADRR